MHEIEIRAVWNTCKERVRSAQPNLVPAHVGNRDLLRQTPDDTGNDAEAPVLTALVTHLEQHLQPHADPEEWHTAFDGRPQARHEAELAEMPHGVGSRTDARHDDAICLVERCRIPAHDDRGTDPLERIDDARQVTGTVVDDDDLHDTPSRWG